MSEFTKERIKELRRDAAFLPHYFTEALDEIERLQAENRALREKAEAFEMTMNSLAEYEADLNARRDAPSAMNDCIERIVTIQAALSAKLEAKDEHRA